ncbi:hypothetical protein WR25_21619 isoform A [Diploscapter pachys]|uniref:Uncharacterized protein n=1 Tax=Diploscapter pachys TaxID=2018661 RepID=A0A2A2LXM1_9BILA|nr:hypothetical protein WR25_21619 isoform A [Diploscapter pachys]
MTDNPAFHHHQEDEDAPRSPSPITVQPTASQTGTDDISDVGGVVINEKPPKWSCYDKTCDIFGNRQGAFIEALRPLKVQLIQTQERLMILSLELDRELHKKHVKETAIVVKEAVQGLNKLMMHDQLNIYPEEAEMLRDVAYDLVALWRILYELKDNSSQATRLRSNTKNKDETAAPSSTHSQQPQHQVVHRDAAGKEFADAKVGVSTVDEHSLKERIGRVNETLEKLIKFIDTKTQRRWWLRDVISFFKLAIKLALFISAVISVVYHSEQTYPIITLVIAIVQGNQSCLKECRHFFNEISRYF